ncbi:YhgE/Pip domain-containing protein [Leucobacter chromiireducens]|uniref:YhgE/Pip domain-containing protein n=1 Tax=Leucobacter chromiireducens TaxID=283877 RepID=UPI000F64128F|nr:YhgE/Pip domain-containing protein [Leucobacter chromiireducens]
MSAALARLSGRKPVRWTTLLGLILVPLTVAGVLLWGLWNPTERLNSVTAAVVNLDEPVELDGQLVPLGRVLAGELIDAGGGAGAAEQTDTAKDDAVDPAKNFTWVLTDEEDAAEGLTDGRYATVVTIPENFSAAATSISGDPDDAETATIDIRESERGRLIDTALSQAVTQTATSVLNQQLGEQFVGGVFVGMNELHRGIGDAADGATKLADGGTQLSSGAKELADGTQQLSDGTQQLSSGAQQLAGGAGELAGGAGQLAGGVSELASGAGQLAGGANDLASGLTEFVSGNGTPENPGLTGYAAGVRSYMSGDGTAENPGLTNYLAGVNEYATGVGGALSEVRTGIGQLAAIDVDAIVAGLELPEGVDPAMVADVLRQGLAALESPEVQQGLGDLDQLIAASNGIAAGAAGYGAGSQGLASGAEQLADGGAQLAAGAAQLATGVGGVASGASALSDGASALAGGASELAGGASGLASGTAELAAGTPALADGAGKLADGVEQTAKGSADLAKGLGQAASGIPNYTEAQRDKLAETAIAPVKSEGGSDELFNASGVPLFAGIALWAGALAAFLVLAPLWRRTREAARGIGFITLRSAFPALGLGAAQGAIAGLILPIALGYDFAQGAGFFGLALLAGIAFALLVQGLSALLGGFGRFVAFTLLVVAFAVGIVSTVPGPLAALGDASPIGAALSGFQAIATGASGAGGAAVLLILWGLAGLVLTGLAVHRTRKA